MAAGALPIRPNGTTGWVPEAALSELQPINTWLKIDTKAYKLTLIKNGKTVFSARVGVGQKQWPTPKGQFFIRAKLEKFGGAGSVVRPGGVHHQRDVTRRSPTGRAAASSVFMAPTRRG